MKLTISHKLIFSFLALTVLVLFATFSLARWSFEKGFLDYVSAREQTRLELIREDLSDEYLRADESWDTLTEDRFNRLRRQSLRRHHANRLPRHHNKDPLLAGKRRKGFGPPTALFDNSDNKIVGENFRHADGEQVRVPIEVDGQVVGELRSQLRRLVDLPQESAFSKQQLRTSWIIAVISLVLATLVSILLAKGLLAPIRRMVSNVHKLSSGNYDARLNERRTDELGGLMNDLDNLAGTLEASRSSRQRFLAEISHELRTPLTILNGEIEALNDGLRPFDKEQLKSLDQEVKRLSYLVNDLHELSLSDLGGMRYIFSPLNLSNCLSDTTKDLQKRAQDLEIELHVPDKGNDTGIWINADAQRIDQLFRNLLENSLAYTDTPGKIDIRLDQTEESAIIEISDTPPGVRETDYTRLFDPLFRQEQSRSRRTGGSGLGLSISQNIVKAHGGEITASSASLGGLTIKIQFPLNRDTGTEIMS